MPMEALQIRTYSSSRHDRFIGFPTPTSVNGSSFYNGSKFLGVGWRTDDTRWQFALVTRSHLLFATHAAPSIGANIRFLNSSNQLVTRQVAEKTVVKNGDNSDSDLILLRLDSPIDESDEVPPFPYLNLPLNAQYLGKAATVFGKTTRAGSGVYEDFAQISGSGLNKTTTIYFDYNLDGGGDDDSRLEAGDSGSPQFGEANGILGLVAINSAIGTEENIQSNFGSFVPHYATKLNTMLSPHGYRMRPSHQGGTSITGSTSSSTAIPRQGNPLSITLTLQNTGINATGNLEADFQFGPGEAPDSISGNGWVNYSNSEGPTVRRGLLNGFSNTTITLSWSSAPLAESLNWSVDWRSDNSSENTRSESLPLGPSFAAWAAGLTQAGVADDPDDDHFLNLSEYAHGSDPELWNNLLPNGETARPRISGLGNAIVFSFPERDDAAMRGLSYIVEWSNDLNPSTWSATPPSSLISSAAPFDPAVPGFVKRTLSWTSTDAQQFARIGITLNE